MEDIRKIWNNSSLISEQQRIDMAKEIEKDIEDEEIKNEVEPKDKQQKYRVSGGFIVVHGKTNSDLQLTTDEKAAFQDTMNEFIEEVSNLVEFYPLNLYSSDVEWSGKIIDMDLEFIFSVGETNGIYVNGTMNKVDEDFLTDSEEVVVKGINIVVSLEDGSGNVACSSVIGMSNDYFTLNSGYSEYLGKTLNTDNMQYCTMEIAENE